MVNDEPLGYREHKVLWVIKTYGQQKQMLDQKATINYT